MTEDKPQPPQIIYSRLSIDGDVVYITYFNAAFLQAPPNCVRREASPMFDPSKAFLLRSCHEFAIAHQASRRITVIGVKT